MEEGKNIKKTVTNPMLSIGRIKQWFKSKSPFKKVLTVFAGIAILFVIYVASVLVRYKDIPINGKTNTAEQTQSEERIFALPLTSGMVCAGLGKYSFQMDSTSSPIVESDKALILQSESGLLLITKGEVKIEEVLKEHTIPFEKKGDTYIFMLSSKLSSDIPSDAPVSAMSVKKGDYTISLLYNPTDKQKAEKMFQAVVASIKGGCSDA